MGCFKGKYRIASTRLPGWDYASAGYYFITIVTHPRIPYFGEIVDSEMHLSPIGAIVAEEWAKTQKIRPNVQLDEWVVMPNHLHGILVITHTPVGTPRRRSDSASAETDRGISTGDRVVETSRRDVSTTTLKPNTLGSILNQFKSVCTKRIRLNCDPDFAWQSRYYDHIIRDEKSLDRIRTYIRYNPLRWAEDNENPTGNQTRLP